MIVFATLSTLRTTPRHLGPATSTAASIIQSRSSAGSMEVASSGAVNREPRCVGRLALAYLVSRIVAKPWDLHVRDVKLQDARIWPK